MKTIPAASVPDWLDQRAGEGRASIGPLEPQVSTGAYLGAFAKLQEAIRAGDIYQANLTFPLAGAARGDPVAIYRRSARRRMPGYGGLVFDGDALAALVQPRTVLLAQGRQGQGQADEGHAPARHAPRPKTAEFAAELAASVKDKAENLMIVDLMRNDLEPRRPRRAACASNAPSRSRPIPRCTR